MTLQNIQVSNFKSFKSLNIDLDKFNVLVGANASGKSNFIQIFKFLRDIESYGLDNAISMQGGVEYVRNISLGSSTELAVKITFNKKNSSEFPLIIEKKTAQKGIYTKVEEMVYDFAIRFNSKGDGFEITRDKIVINCDLFESKIMKKSGKIKGKRKFGSMQVSFFNAGGKLKRKIKIPKGVPINKEEIIMFPRSVRIKIPPRELILQTPILSIFHLFFQLMESRTLPSISIYDFDPKLPKKAAQITGRKMLEEDGSNLAIVLKDITNNEEKNRKLSNLIKELLPFAGKLDISELPDKSMIFKLQETYSSKPLPSSLLSDGTINLTALIVALYFDKRQVTLIEEPERDIHPQLISKVVNLLKEASKDKQVIVTTHNPQIVKYAGLENILLISRDKKGFSVISRPSNSEQVKTFLKHQIGLEELQVQNLLG